MAKSLIAGLFLATMASVFSLPLAFRDIGNSAPPESVISLSPDQTVGQKFRCNFSNLFSIGIWVAPSKTTEGQEFYFHVKTALQAKEDLVFRKIVADDLKLQWKPYHLPLETSFTSQGFYYYIEFEPLGDSAGKDYYFYLEGKGLNVGIIHTSYYPGLTQGNLYLNHRPADGNLAFLSYCTWREGFKEIYASFWNRLKQDPVFLIGYCVLVLSTIAALCVVRTVK